MSNIRRTQSKSQQFTVTQPSHLPTKGTARGDLSKCQECHAKNNQLTGKQMGRKGTPKWMDGTEKHGQTAGHHTEIQTKPLCDEGISNFTNWPAPPFPFRGIALRTADAKQIGLRHTFRAITRTCPLPLMSGTVHHLFIIPFPFTHFNSSKTWGILLRTAVIL